jgi:hypothetical protein
MRLIFSRKGFDTQNGGVPSPILPDGRMCSLPIPDGSSQIRYSDIMWDDVNLGKVVSDLTGNRIRGTTRAHLDPDINPAALRRRKGWLGILGPSRPAYTHLQRCGFSEGDLFLFFGWFRQAAWSNGVLRFVPRAPDIHVIFGWLKVETIKPVEEFSAAERRWADYHPHFSPDRTPEEVICLARSEMSLPKMTHPLPGFGVFPVCESILCLTAPFSTRSRWRLPKWFLPTKGKTPLSRHADIRRWHRTRDWTYLDTVPVGQEFVLDCKEYPETFDWLREIFGCLE